MDKNQITGIILIGLIMVGFFYYTKPSQEELARQEQQRDSIAALQRESIAQKGPQSYQANEVTETEGADTFADSSFLQTKYGNFAPFMQGKELFYTLENEQIKVVLSNKGAKVYSVELKEYLTHDKKPLILFEGEESEFNFNFFSNSNRSIATKELFFDAQTSRNSVDFQLNMASGKQMTMRYTLPDEGYLLSTSINGSELEQLIPRSQTALDLTWKQDMRQVEKGREFEQRYSGLFYKYFEDEVGRCGQDKSEKLSTKVKWLAYKDQFFSTVLIAENAFSSANIDLKKSEVDGYTHFMSSNIVVPIDGKDINYSFYFGPNDYKLLRSMGMDLDRLVDMGKHLTRFINRIIVVNVFNFLERFTGNYGLIILLLTIFIKLLVFPFTYKSYISSAKMRLLKPEIEAINKKIPSDKAMERQQATMALYKKAGANPLGGCLPLALSMPFLLAMFRFFPGSIELRQESFLWATDLAAYDAIISWSRDIPLISKFYGNHVSLFTLLMALSNIIYTRINQEMTAASSQQMPGMKGMMYMMPIMFLFIFNRYSAGLSYYYFVSTLITILQTVFMRRLVNEDALHAQLQANKKKAPKKPSKFQQRLAEMQKQQQQVARQQAKKKR